MPFNVPNLPDVSYTDQAEPDSIDFQILADDRFGVYSGGDASQQGTPNMTVALTEAVVIRDGQAPTVAAGSVAFAAAGANPRFDLIVVNAGGAWAVLTGTADPNPRMPTWDRTSTVLHAVYIPAGTTAITNNLIIDKRRRVSSIRLSGAGTNQSPEGVVSAPPGAEWLCTAVEVDDFATPMWIKKGGGTGNTGWAQVRQWSGYDFPTNWPGVPVTFSLSAGAIDSSPLASGDTHILVIRRFTPTAAVAAGTVVTQSPLTHKPNDTYGVLVSSSGQTLTVSSDGHIRAPQGLSAGVAYYGTIIYHK